jgi:EAL domain-containing protein (putative c-di-GMP-specific phosphodiesterase class I)
MERPVVLGGAPRKCTISLGLTIFPDDATKPSDLLKNADLALYRAKERGRDRYELFTGEMRTSIESSYQLHHDVQQALATGAFCLAYQPIVSASGSQRVSFEALLRWNHPERGLLLPAAFEEVFDDPKVASQIGRQVIDRAICQAAAWERSGLEFGRIAVNVTSADFALGGFAEYVDSKLREHGVSPERLCIEVTERVFLGRSADGVAAALQKLHDMGVEIALDDFGTGFASLSHLKKLPIDRLKVDCSFVRDMETNPDNMAIVRTITHLGQSLGIKVTAEGVETPSQVTLLRAMGCDTMQGYLFSKPMDAAQVEAYLDTKRVRRA